MKKPLADVLWTAANKRLSPIGTMHDEDAPPDGLDEFSCHAAMSAAYGVAARREETDVERFFHALGCDTYCSASDGWPSHIDVQGTRYMWLLLAMHVAEDEGIMVEVTK